MIIRSLEGLRVVTCCHEVGWTRVRIHHSSILRVPPDKEEADIRDNGDNRDNGFSGKYFVRTAKDVNVPLALSLETTTTGMLCTGGAWAMLKRKRWNRRNPTLSDSEILGPRGCHKNPQATKHLHALALQSCVLVLFDLDLRQGCRYCWELWC